MTKKLYLIVSSMFLSSYNCFSQTPTPTGNDNHWQLKWYDDFRSLAKSALNDGRQYVGGTWVDELGNTQGNWGVLNDADHGGEPQMYINANTTSGPSNGSLGLKLTAQKQDYFCASCTTGGSYPNHHYVSGCVSSGGDTNLLTGRLVRYGYIEAKITMSNTFSLWSAFWLWNCSRAGGNCNYDSDEVDIIETIDGKTVGEPCQPYYNQQGNKTFFSSGIPISQVSLPVCDPRNTLELISVNDYTQPHVYGLEWSPSKIIWYIDGKAVRNSINPGFPGDPKGNISQALHIILGAQISGFVNWEIGSPNGIYDVAYNNRADYYNYFDKSYPYVPSGSSVNRATSYSNPPYNGPVNLNTTPSNMYIEYVKYYTLKQDCSTPYSISDNASLVAYNTTYNNNVKKSITISGTGITTATSNSPKSLRATDYIIINGDFVVPSGTELYLDVNPCE